MSERVEDKVVKVSERFNVRMCAGSLAASKSAELQVLEYYCCRKSSSLDSASFACRPPDESE